MLLTYFDWHVISVHFLGVQYDISTHVYRTDWSNSTNWQFLPHQELLNETYFQVHSLEHTLCKSVWISMQTGIDQDK